MATDDFEQQEQPAPYPTVGERLAALEVQQRLLIDDIRENRRRSDDNYRTLDSKVDRLTYLLLGIAGTAAVAYFIQLLF